jgi:hypothetical protein
MAFAGYGINAMATTGTATLTIGELREFASFASSEQRYIRRSLDIGLGRQDAFKLWARDEGELASIRKQYVAYQDLKMLRAMRPDDLGFEDVEAFMGKLVRMAAFDLAQEKMTSFSSFRFLYERRFLRRRGAAPDPPGPPPHPAPLDQRSRRHRSRLVRPRTQLLSRVHREGSGVSIVSRPRESRSASHR